MENKIKIIESIWRNGALKIDHEDPFILTSGSLSPIYIDCRLLISDVNFRKIFSEEAKKKLNNLNFDVVAGGATAGIPYATLVAQELGSPMIYVRKDPKGHGRAAQIEGLDDLNNKKVLLVEDLITEGLSKLRFMGGIERAGGTMEHCFVLFDREQNGRKKLKEHGIRLISLVSLRETLDYGLKNNYIEKEEYNSIEHYLNDPEGWQKKLKEKD